MREPIANKIGVANLGTVYNQTNHITIQAGQEVALIYSDPVPDLRFFQGRLAERADLTAWLADGAVSMIGIRGEGGIGKSTLMAKVFAESLGFAGKFWADVRAGTSIATLARRALQELGVPLEQVDGIEEKDLMPRLLRHLQQGRYLLAIDNLESMLTATGDWQSGYQEFFRQFLQHDRQSVLLLASREYPLKYRSWHPAKWLTLNEGLQNSEGAALLESLRVTGAIAERERVSERVKGSPLALSIIAGWLRANDSFDPHVRYLAEQTDLWQVEGEHRDQDNISVDRVLQWSIDRLTPAQQHLLTQVSVLRGAFNAEAATALATESVEADAMPATAISDADLDDLERRSLLQILPERDKHQLRLFRLQSRIRDFVQRAADLTTAHERAIAYFWSHRQTEFAREDTQDAITDYEETFYHEYQLRCYEGAVETVLACDAFLRRRGYTQILVDLYSQLYNDWQPTSEQRQAYAAVCGNLGLAYYSLGQYQRAIDLQQQHYEIAHEIGDRGGEAASLGNLGLAYYLLGQYQQAIDFQQQSLGIDREIGNRGGEAASLGNLGNAYRALGRYQQAIDFHQQSLEIAREIGNRGGEAASLGSLGNAYQSLGQYQQAIGFHQQSLEIKREIGNRGGEAASLGSLGNAYQSLGQYQQAIGFHQQSLEIKREIGDREGEANSLGNLGHVYQSLGQYQRAIDFLQQHYEIAHEIGDRRGEASSLVNLGNAYQSLGQYQWAIDFHQQSLEIAREIGALEGEAASLGNLGNAYRALGRYQQAIDFLQQTLEIVREISDRRGEANSLGNLGNAYQSLGQYQRAIDFHQQHYEIAREIGDRRGEANSLGSLGAAYDSLGQYQRAIDFLQQHYEIAREIGDRGGEAKSLGNLGLGVTKI